MSAASPGQSPSQSPGQLKPACVVTGGSEGIGYALAARFAKGGHDLLLVARNLENLRKAAAEIHGTTGRRVEVAPVDLTAPDACRLIDEALQSHGLYCHTLINNAGAGLGGEFTQHGRAALLQLVDLNVRALTALMHHYLPPMLARDEGGILNVASLGGMVAGPYQAAYYASKAYVISLTRAVSEEIARSRVRISVLAPGPVATRFHERMGVGSAIYLKLPGTISAARVARGAYFGYRIRQTVIVPGILATVAARLISIIPPALLTSITAVLLKKRY